MKENMSDASQNVLYSNPFAQVHLIDLKNNISEPSNDEATVKGLAVESIYGTVLVSLLGGQVLQWQPKNQQEVFWLSKTSQYQQGKAIRGGIPLCWPWFGAYHKDTNKTVHLNHGFARQNTWQIDSIDADEKQVKIVLSLSGENFHEVWPHAFTLKQTLIFNDSFQQCIEIFNLSNQSVEFTGALHSYFKVSAPENVSIQTLSSLPFDDKLTGQHESAQPLKNCMGPVDRVYHCHHNISAVNTPRFHSNEQTPQFVQSLLESEQLASMKDESWNRVIEISTKNTQQWVLWNPGAKIAQSMADVHLGGEKNFVCLEAANTQWQSLRAGECTSMSQTIRVINLT